MVGASTSSAGSLDKAHEEMMDFLESCGLAHMKGVFHLTNDDNSSSEDASSTVLESGDARSRYSYFHEMSSEKTATVGLAVKPRALKPLSLGQLLVLITRHGELSKSNVWPRDRRRLLACAQDYLLHIDHLRSSK